MQSALSLFDLVPGKLLEDRFLIQDTSRQGGMAAVFRVRDQAHDEDVELQLFTASLFDTEKERAEFAALWERWLGVSAPTLAGLREVVELGGGLALVTDLPHGRSLRKLLDEGRSFEEAQVIELGLAMCGGLGALHGRSLAHGDVKPQTIFVDEASPNGLAPQLVDAGITSALWTAKHLGEQTALIGTPFYAPVEQFGGSAPDATSDVYNLAVVLFELLAGKLPWGGTSFLEVFQAKLAKETPRFSMRNPEARVSPELEAVIARGMAGARQDRFPDAVHFGAALADLA